MQFRSCNHAGMKILPISFAAYSSSLPPWFTFSSFTFPFFPFISPFQFHSKHYYFPTQIPVIDEREEFLESVRYQCQLGFSDLKSPISLFHQLTSLRPLPSVILFNQLFAATLKLKRLQPHSTIIPLFRHLELSGIRPNMYSVGILANCYCHLGRLDFGLSLLGKGLKLGYPP